ncbi:hypothetical protein D3C74_477200 [compost metagenome]
MGQFVGRQLARFVLAQPLEDFYQFGHFDAGGHGQVLRAVEAAPVIGIADLMQALGEFLQVHRGSPIAA